MKRKTGIVLISMTALIVIGGVAAWYYLNNRQAEAPAQQQASTTTTESTNDNKFASLKGEAFDEAYIGDMIAHHEGAVNMAEMVGGATQRQELLTLAQDIMKTQSMEIMDMRNWQTEWGYEPTMGGHGSHGGTANDMSGEMMDMGNELNGLTGAEFEKKFLELMIVHHQQAVDMSKYADTNASHDEVKKLAATVIAAQEAEIAQMQQWQRDWGYATSDGSTSSSMPGMNH